MKNFLNNLLSHNKYKWVIPAALLCLCLFICLIVIHPLSRPKHQFLIDIESDKDGVIIVYYPDKNDRYSDNYTVSKKLQKGTNHLRFVLLDNFTNRLKNFRVDPTNQNNSKLTVTGIRYIYKNRHEYRVPLEKLSTVPTAGMKLLSISPDKVVIQSLTHDPIWFLNTATMKKSPYVQQTNLTSKYTKSIGAALILWIVLLHALQKYLGSYYPGFYKVLNPLAKGIYILLALGFLYILLRDTEILGKVTCGLLVMYAIKYIVCKEWKQEPVPENIKPNFDWSMHYFRAIAISCICIGHMLYIPGKALWSTSFFTSDSVYFLFISGYLAQFLFTKKPESPLVYYKKKIYNVICPYLFFSLIIITILIFLPKPELFYAYNGGRNWKNVFKAIMYGKAIAAYWYIPFVTLLFVVTPLLVRLPDKYFLQILFLCGFAFIIFPKRGDFGILKDEFYMYTHFSFAYVLGFAFSRFRNILEPHFKNLFFPALFLALLIGGFLLFPENIKLKLAPIDTLRLVQKFFFLICFVTIVNYLKNKKIKLLDNLAVFSFTLFFLHMIFLNDLQKIYLFYNGYMRNFSDLFGIAICVAYFFYMLFLSILLKKIFGKYSRYFIGS